MRRPADGARRAAAAVGLLALAAACAAVRPELREETRLLADVETLLDLVERPEDVAIFPLEDRTGLFAAGAAGAEVLATEMGRTHLFDGARVAEVRDRLLLSGRRWTETADDSEAVRIARRIGATAILAGSVDEWRTDPHPVVAGTLRLRGTDGRLYWVAAFSAEDRSIWTDRARTSPTALLVRGIGAAIDDLALRLERPAVARADSIAAVVDREAGEAAGDTAIPSAERTVLERILDERVGEASPLLRLRRLAQDRREVRDIYVAVRYRRRIEAMLASDPR